MERMSAHPRAGEEGLHFRIRQDVAGSEFRAEGVAGDPGLVVVQRTEAEHGGRLEIPGGERPELLSRHDRGACQQGAPFLCEGQMRGPPRQVFGQCELAVKLHEDAPVHLDPLHVRVRACLRGDPEQARHSRHALGQRTRLTRGRRRAALTMRAASPIRQPEPEA
jgi:hypothetical protein